MINIGMLTCIGVFALSGTVMCILAVPLMRRRIKPNGLYGLRVPATFADEWVWYEANAHSGRDLLCLGLAQIVLTFALTAVPRISLAAYALSIAAFVIIGVIGFAIIGTVRANRLLEQRRSSGSQRTGSKFASG